MKPPPGLQGNVKTSTLHFHFSLLFFIHCLFPFSILFNIFILTIPGSVYLFPFLISLILLGQMHLKLPKNFTDVSLWNHARIYTEITFPHCYFTGLNRALEATEYASGCWKSIPYPQPSPVNLAPSSELTVILLRVEVSDSFELDWEHRLGGTYSSA